MLGVTHGVTTQSWKNNTHICDIPKLLDIRTKNNDDDALMENEDSLSLAKWFEGLDELVGVLQYGP